MSAVLAGIGSGIFVLLGLAHAVFTLQSTPDGGPMMPTDPAVRDAMQIEGGLGLAPDIRSTLFAAWIGFNLSHSIGALAIGGVLLHGAISDFGGAAGNPWFVMLAVITPALYFVLALRYWFAKPRNAVVLAALLIWAGLVLEII